MSHFTSLLLEITHLRAENESLQARLDQAIASRDLVRQESRLLARWINTVGRSCPSNATVDAVLDRVSFERGA